MPKKGLRHEVSTDCLFIPRCETYFLEKKTYEALTDCGGDPAGEHVVDVADQRVKLRDELDEPLGQHHHSVVLAGLRALHDHHHQVVHNLVSSRASGQQYYFTSTCRTGHDLSVCLQIN